MKKTMTKTMTKTTTKTTTKTATTTKTKTQTMCLKNPTYAIFLKYWWLTHSKYDDRYLTLVILCMPVTLVLVIQSVLQGRVYHRFGVFVIVFNLKCLYMIRKFSSNFLVRITKMTGRPGQTRPLTWTNMELSWEKICKLIFFQIPFGIWWHWVSRARSLKSVLVLPPQIFDLFGPPRKRVNFDKFNQRQKCVFCVLTALYVSK